MSTEEIHAAIPHRRPMLLVDEIAERSGERIVCRKTFGDDEFFFQGHYPDYPLVPGVILCESAMQAGAILLSSRFGDGQDGVPVVSRLSEAKFKRMVRPGDTIESEVTISEQLADFYFLKAKVTCGGKTAVTFSFACKMAPLEP